MDPPIVAITGITGYVGSEICKQALLKYKVRGIVRDLPKGMLLKNKVPELHSPNLQIVRAANTDPLAKWEEALEGVTYLIHTASPTDFNLPEGQIINEACKGVENAMRAAINKKVKKVVFTSSLIAAWDGKNTTIDETTWNDVSTARGYPKSKLLSEKLAWELYDKQPTKDTQLTVLLPSWVMGPTILEHPRSSLEIIKLMMKDKMIIVNSDMPMVDVRDCAQAHLAALENSKSDGKRYLLSSANIYMNDIAKILNDHFKEYGINISYKPSYDWVVKALALFIKKLSTIVMELNKPTLVGSKKATEELGIMYTPIKDTIIQSGFSCLFKQ